MWLKPFAESDAELIEGRGDSGRVSVYGNTIQDDTDRVDAGQPRRPRLNWLAEGRMVVAQRPSPTRLRLGRARANQVFKRPCEIAAKICSGTLRAAICLVFRDVLEVGAERRRAEVQAVASQPSANVVVLWHPTSSHPWTMLCCEWLLWRAFNLFLTIHAINGASIPGL